MVTIIQRPSAGTLSGVQSICVQATTQFASSVSGGRWTSNNIAIATIDSISGMVLGIAAGTATMTYTVIGPSGCNNTATRTITVSSPLSPVNIVGLPAVCVGSTSTFSLSPSVTGGAWSSEDASIASVSPTGVVTGVASGAVTIWYIRTGCAPDTASRLINVIACVPVVTTSSVTNLTDSSVQMGGNVTAERGESVSSRGVVYHDFPLPELSNPGVSFTEDGDGLGVFTSQLTGLYPATQYFARAYATNAVGTAYGNQLTFITSYRIGTVLCSSLPTWVDTVYNPVTGKIWTDQNLGASTAANSIDDPAAFGDLYQWGRFADGHQCRNSSTTATRSATDAPGNNLFITHATDWRSTINNNLWQGLTGANNPCPFGYRLPTAAEFEAERLSWSTNDGQGAFSSPLGLTEAGFRNNATGVVTSGSGAGGSYWTSTISGTFARYLQFSTTGAGLVDGSRALGHSVRCIKN